MKKDVIETIYKNNKKNSDLSKRSLNDVNLLFKITKKRKKKYSFLSKTHKPFINSISVLNKRIKTFVFQTSDYFKEDHWKKVFFLLKNNTTINQMFLDSFIGNNTKNISFVPFPGYVERQEKIEYFFNIQNKKNINKKSHISNIKNIVLNRLINDVLVKNHYYLLYFIKDIINDIHKSFYNVEFLDFLDDDSDIVDIFLSSSGKNIIIYELILSLFHQLFFKQFVDQNNQKRWIFAQNSIDSVYDNFEIVQSLIVEWFLKFGNTNFKQAQFNEDTNSNQIQFNSFAYLVGILSTIKKNDAKNKDMTKDFFSSQKDNLEQLDILFFLKDQTFIEENLYLRTNKVVELIYSLFKKCSDLRHKNISITTLANLFNKVEKQLNKDYNEMFFKTFSSFFKNFFYSETEKPLFLNNVFLKTKNFNKFFLKIEDSEDSEVLSDDLQKNYLFNMDFYLFSLLCLPGVLDKETKTFSLSLGHSSSNTKLNLQFFEDLLNNRENIFHQNQKIANLLIEFEPFYRKAKDFDNYYHINSSKNKLYKESLDYCNELVRVKKNILFNIFSKKFFFQNKIKPGFLSKTENLLENEKEFVEITLEKMRYAINCKKQYTQNVVESRKVYQESDFKSLSEQLSYQNIFFRSMLEDLETVFRIGFQTKFRKKYFFLNFKAFFESLDIKTIKEITFDNAGLSVITLDLFSNETTAALMLEALKFEKQQFNMQIMEDEKHNEKHNFSIDSEDTEYELYKPYILPTEEHNLSIDSKKEDKLHNATDVEVETEKQVDSKEEEKENDVEVESKKEKKEGNINTKEENKKKDYNIFISIIATLFFIFLIGIIYTSGSILNFSEE